MGNATRSTRYIRWLYELLVSTYCAFAIVDRGALGEQESAVLRLMQVPLRLLSELLVHLLNRPLYSNPMGSFKAEWCLATVVIFLGLHLLGRTNSTRTPLCLVTGAAVVAGPALHPFLWPSLWNTRWLWLEVVPIIGCVILYVCRRLPKNPGLGVLILLLHFGFWAFVLVSEHPWWHPWWENWLWVSGLVILPFCAGLVWGAYIRLSATAPGHGLPA